MIRPIVAFISVFLTATVASADVFRLDAIARGQYSFSVGGGVGNNGRSATNPYTDGNFQGLASTYNWFHFDLSNIDGLVIEAAFLISLTAVPGPTAVGPMPPTATLSIEQINEEPSQLGTPSVVRPRVIQQSLGRAPLTALDAFTLFEIPFNAAGVDLLQSLATNDVALRVEPSGGLGFMFANTGSADYVTRIRITTAASVPEPASLLLMSIGIGGFVTTRVMRSRKG